MIRHALFGFLGAGSFSWILFNDVPTGAGYVLIMLASGGAALIGITLMTEA